MKKKEIQEIKDKEIEEIEDEEDINEDIFQYNKKEIEKKHKIEQKEQKEQENKEERIEESMISIKKQKVSNNSENNKFYFDCFICGMSLSLMEEDEREYHLSLCIDRLETKEGNDNNDLKSNYYGLRSENYGCLFCGLSLTKKSLTIRCQHIKRCSKIYGIGIKELLQMISPEKYEEILTQIDNNNQNYNQNNTTTTILTKNSKGDNVEVVEIIDDDDDEDNDNDGGDVNFSDSNYGMKIQEQIQLKDKLHQELIIEPIKQNLNSILLANARIKWGQSNTTSSSSTTTTTNTTNTTHTTRSSSYGQRSYWNRNSSKSLKSSNSASIKDDEIEVHYAPEYKKILVPPMTVPIIVDGFSFASSNLSDCYFLTHFHSDHYGGLTKNFDCGMIYCSTITCSLVSLKLGVKKEYLRPLELEKRNTILCNGYPIEVILTEANHCPGAVCILFIFPNGKKIFHTGDFRWNDQLLHSSNTLQTMANNKSNSHDLTVYLDTTYCESQYTFPPQNETIEVVINCIREERKILNTLFVFGAYGIGKERMYMSVSEEFDMKVYVENSRWKTMLCYGWPITKVGKLTKDKESTWLWVAPMNTLNFESLNKMKHNKIGCQRVVAFQPTGWSHSTTNSNDIGLLKSKRKDGNTIYSVPYSEHSSFTELIDFIRLFRPHRIVPTVNTSKEKVKEQLQLLRLTVDSLDNPHPYASTMTVPNPKTGQTFIRTFISEFK